MLFLTLSGLTSRAQTYWLRYALTLGGDYSVGNLYDSGLVQNTSLLTTQLVTAGAVWTAKATPSASYGSLRLTAACAVTNLLWNGNGHTVRFIPGGDAAPGFQDQLKVTSATLPVGTPVQFVFRTVIAGYIDPGVAVIPGAVYSSGGAAGGRGDATRAGLGRRPRAWGRLLLLQRSERVASGTRT